MKLFPRIFQPPVAQSYFLFGARNTGKSTLLKALYKKQTLWVDLLDVNTEQTYARTPSLLKEEVLALNDSIKYVVVDEIQKIPKLLDVIHQLCNLTNKIFILTGSSARKLKYGGANLLAGRAFVYNLYPLTSFEIGSAFDLDHTLNWGSLPSVVNKDIPDEQKAHFLRAYTQTYLKEEIWMEQFIRKLDPFRKFLEVAAQANGDAINLANIARDVGVDGKTIKEYFSILEDTLMGVMLEPFHGSVRKRLSTKPKFYFFDGGVCRALTRMLTVPLRPASADYGKAFEHFIILECIRLSGYFYPDYRFSYLRTKDGVEVDLVVERPGQTTLLIEIKSATHPSVEKLNAFIALSKEFKNATAICISQSPNPRMIDHIHILPWQKALEQYFIPKKEHTP